jgi:hypothetical protein
MTPISNADHSALAQPSQAAEHSLEAQTTFPEKYRGKFIRYQESGFKVVPVHIDYVNGKKYPTFPASWKNASFTYNDFKPHHNGLFIVTGNESKLEVIDFDLTLSELSKLLNQYGVDIREYCHCWTPSGGLHIYLSDAYREYWLARYGRNTLTTANPLLHVDIRHDNAGVFAPGTEIPGYGKYTWVIPPYDPLALEYDVATLTPLMDAIFAPQEANSTRQSVPVSLPNTSYEDDYQKAEALVAVLAAMVIDYQDWIKVGMALKSAFGERGKVLWDCFMNNPNYDTPQRTMDTHWRSFSGNRVGIGSLFYVAQKYGVMLCNQQ